MFRKNVTDAKEKKKNRKAKPPGPLTNACIRAGFTTSSLADDWQTETNTEASPPTVLILSVLILSQLVFGSLASKWFAPAEFYLYIDNKDQSILESH